MIKNYIFTGMLISLVTYSANLCTTKATFDLLVKKSEQFATHSPFPTSNNRIALIAADNSAKQEIIIQHAQNTHPLIHKKALSLIKEFLTYKKRSGSRIEKKLYKHLTPRKFIDRLLCKRPLMFMTAAEHNLQNVDVSIPTQQLVVLTGVSGSGKSTFLFEIVDKVARRYFYNASEEPGKYASVEGLEHFSRVVTVDQATIGATKSSRSNVATYTKLFDRIRELFASLPESKIRGFNAEKFSFNTSDERCQNCNGAGVVEVDMTFMPDIEQECPECNGMRFNETLLTVQFQGHNIANILDMTVRDAITIFRRENKIFALLEMLKKVGLEYLKLGQSTSTLSGGEAQRIKLAAELSKPETGSTLYLLDEPTTGLHPQEVERLLEVLQMLVSKGNTVVVIEHNVDAMCAADTIIDFGPGGGSAGGTIVATGTVEEIMANQNSLIGQALKTYITASYRKVTS